MENDVQGCSRGKGLQILHASEAETKAHDAKYLCGLPCSVQAEVASAIWEAEVDSIAEQSSIPGEPAACAE